MQKNSSTNARDPGVLYHHKCLVGAGSPKALQLQIHSVWL